MMGKIIDVMCAVYANNSTKYAKIAGGTLIPVITLTTARRWFVTGRSACQPPSVCGIGHWHAGRLSLTVKVKPVRLLRVRVSLRPVPSCEPESRSTSGPGPAR